MVFRQTLLGTGLAALLMCGPGAGVTQERGEEPPSLLRQLSIIQLQQDAARKQGFDATDIARQRDLLRLRSQENRRQTRNDYAGAGLQRLKADQQARQDLRVLRGHNPAARRQDRRRDRMDRRLRARINRR